MIRTVKLMACTMCGDVLRLIRIPRWCRCRSCVGKQRSIKRVEVAGPCIVAGLGKEDFDTALRAGRTLKRPLRWFYIPSGDEVTRTNVNDYEGVE